MTPQGDEHDAVVIVLNYANAGDTEECLAAVLAQRGVRYRVHVIDNASPDGSAARLADWLAAAAGHRGSGDLGNYCSYGPIGTAAEVGLTLSAVNGGYAAGNNLGLRRAGDCRYAWVLNNDAVPEPDALARLIATAQQKPSAGVVGALVLDRNPDSGAERIQCLGGSRVDRLTGRNRPLGAGLSPDAAAALPLTIDYVSGCSMLLPVAVLRRVGLLREGLFLFCEEIDLMHRLAAAGFGWAVARDAVVRHQDGRSSGTSWQVRRKKPSAVYWSTRSAVLVTRMHRPSLVLPVAIARLGYAARLAALSPALGRAAVRGLWAGLRNPLSQLHVPTLPDGHVPLAVSASSAR